MTTRLNEFEAIGTKWQIGVDSAVSQDDWTKLLKKIQARIEAFDKAYSRFRSDSLVTRMSQKAGRYELPKDGYKLLEFYKQLYDSTAGKVTPLIGQVVSDAGYDANYSLKTGQLHKPPKWEKVITYGQDFIELKQPALLDFGAAGKGYLVDIINDLMSDAGLESYLINAGSDLLRRSATKQSIDVGLENPRASDEVVGVVRLTNQSLCASAGNKRQWGTFTHIIDPDQLRSPDKILATWVLADDTLTADGVATALFFTPAEHLLKRFKFSFAMLDQTMNLNYSADFPASLFEAPA